MACWPRRLAPSASPSNRAGSTGPAIHSHRLVSHQAIQAMHRRLRVIYSQRTGHPLSIHKPSTALAPAQLLSPNHQAPLCPAIGPQPLPLCPPLLGLSPLSDPRACRSHPLLRPHHHHYEGSSDRYEVPEGGPTALGVGMGFCFYFIYFTVFYVLLCPSPWLGAITQERVTSTLP